MELEEAMEWIFVQNGLLEKLMVNLFERCIVTYHNTHRRLVISKTTNLHYKRICLTKLN
jgi:hypothetical protein